MGEGEVKPKCLGSVWVCAEKSPPTCLSVRLVNGLTCRWVTIRTWQGQDTSTGRWWLHYLLKDRWKLPVSSTALTANVSAAKTEELLNHTNHNTEFSFIFCFVLTRSWGSTGSALFSKPIDFAHCFNNLPTSFSRGRENKNNGFVIIFHNSAIDFCCKAPAPRQNLDLSIK